MRPFLNLKKALKKKREKNIKIKKEKETVIKQYRVFQIIWGQLLNMLISNFLANFSSSFLCFLAVD